MCTYLSVWGHCMINFALDKNVACHCACILALRNNHVLTHVDHNNFNWCCIRHMHFHSLTRHFLLYKTDYNSICVLETYWFLCFRSTYFLFWLFLVVWPGPFNNKLAGSFCGPGKWGEVLVFRLACRHEQSPSLGAAPCCWHSHTPRLCFPHSPSLVAIWENISPLKNKTLGKLLKKENYKKRANPNQFISGVSLLTIALNFF